jgi:hypothetical protein
MGTDARLTLAFTSSLTPDAQDSLVTSLNRLLYQRGEERLMLAILKDAVDCIERYCYGHRAGSRPDYETALAWVRTRDTVWLFSFENICLELDLNPDRLRSSLESLPLRSLTKNHAGTSLLTVSATHRLALR